MVMTTASAGLRRSIVTVTVSIVVVGIATILLA
jgi:hypothetical protein